MLELSLMQTAAPAKVPPENFNIVYHRLTSLQKQEVFRFARDNTSGDDLAKSMWLSSSDSESWLDRRTLYTRSLALMSVVGYMLGLGDRHPSNIMLQRSTGKVVHIDFGDCWEVAQMRDLYPEKVPFRLTRMLVNAMEVGGIDGTFRSTCELVLGVLRQNRSSVMAMLETFVYVVFDREAREYHFFSNHLPHRTHSCHLRNSDHSSNPVSFSHITVYSLITMQLEHSRISTHEHHARTTGTTL